jgi:hypothetical protein
MEFQGPKNPGPSRTWVCDRASCERASRPATGPAGAPRTIHRSPRAPTDPAPPARPPSQPTTPARIELPKGPRFCPNPAEACGAVRPNHAVPGRLRLETYAEPGPSANSPDPGPIPAGEHDGSHVSIDRTQYCHHIPPAPHSQARPQGRSKNDHCWGGHSCLPLCAPVEGRSCPSRACTRFNASPPPPPPTPAKSPHRSSATTTACDGAPCTARACPRTPA